MTSKLFIIAFALLITKSGAQAQVIWDLKHSDSWFSGSVMDSSICFTDVSCSGNDCTAAAIVMGNPTKPSFFKRITFYRSNDGGVSWHEQPLGIVLPSLLTNFGITKIEQIDSLNVVGIGDLGVILRSFDAGNSWQKQILPTLHKLEDIHFSDSLTGVVCVADSANNIYTTSDGGRYWNLAPFGGSYIWQCHSYGGGKFRLFQYGLGPVYTTYDNFKTIETTGLVFDSLTDPKWDRHLLAKCTFGGGDTMLAYSKYFPSDTVNIFGGYGLIMRSIDGGKHWEKPFIYPTTVISQIDHTTSLDRDTIYAGGESNNFFLMSIDRGKTWQADTILIDTSYNPYACFGLAMPSDGHPIGIFTYVPIAQQSILTRGEFPKAHVDYIERIIYYTYIYPNPATGIVNISSIDVSKPIHIIDILGREVLHGVLSDQGKLSLDVSNLSAGVYEVLLDHFGQRFAVGKIAVVGR